MHIVIRTIYRLVGHRRAGGMTGRVILKAYYLWYSNSIIWQNALILEVIGSCSELKFIMSAFCSATFLCPTEVYIVLPFRCGFFAVQPNSKTALLFLVFYSAVMRKRAPVFDAAAACWILGQSISFSFWIQGNSNSTLEVGWISISFPEHRDRNRQTYCRSGGAGFSLQPSGIGILPS